MSKKVRMLLILLLAVLSLVSACERKASRAPVVVPQKTDKGKTPLPINNEYTHATQTAQAVSAQFNQPTMIVTNSKGTAVAITAMPATPTPAGPPTPTPLPPTPVVTKPAKYAVQSGETIYCLARRFDVDPDDLLAANGLDNWSMLHIGQELTIPQTGKWPGPSRAIEGTSHPDVWQVSPGETVYMVACAYGDVYPEQILAVNGNIKDPNDLTGLKTIQIP